MASEVLAGAFEDYPWARWSIPRDDYTRRLVQLQDLYLRHALREGVVLVEERVDGVIALLPPYAPAPSSELQRQVAKLHGDRLELVAGTDLPAAPDGYWTLEVVGVRPERQGAGLGTELILAGLRAAKASGGAGVSLETSADSNVRIYERAGFSITSVTRIDHGPVVHSMVAAFRD